MNPQAPAMLIFIAVGFVLAGAFEVFNQKSAFAKAHGTISFFAQLALVVVAVAASIHFTRDWSGWILVLIGFFVVGKIKEGRDNRRKLRDLTADYQARVTAALSTREGGDAVEIDVTKAPDAVRHTLINTRTKQGLTVETVKNESTGTLKLRFSVSATKAN
jgi:uncharacterized membrane protein YccC